MLYAQILALLLAIPAGVYAAYRSNQRGDRVTSTAALIALSVPNFVVAIVLILIFALGGLSIFGSKVGISYFPTSRYVPFGQDPVEHFKHMALPTIALALGLAAVYMRVLRSDMISTLQENFITTAKAKGVPDRRILWGHALRPSSFTLLTVAGVNTATLIGGALIIETIFSLPGLGTLLDHRHLPEGLPHRAGRRGRHRRRLHHHQLPRGRALRGARSEGAQCPCLTSTPVRRRHSRPPPSRATRPTARASWASGSGRRACGSSLLVFSAFFASFLPLKDPTTAFAGVSRSGPSAAHWFGADNIGHDIFSRTIYGARRSLFVSFRGDGVRFDLRRRRSA